MPHFFGDHRALLRQRQVREKSPVEEDLPAFDDPGDVRPARNVSILFNRRVQRQGRFAARNAALGPRDRGRLTQKRKRSQRRQRAHEQDHAVEQADAVEAQHEGQREARKEKHRRDRKTVSERARGELVARSQQLLDLLQPAVDVVEQRFDVVDGLDVPDW